jgi:release factor glutamine methyltransferase
MDKLEIAKAGREIIANSDYGITQFKGQEIIILPKVFPADCTTPFIADIMTPVAQRIAEAHGKCRVLEMGAGSGAAILTLAKMPQVEAHASDISPMSVLCVKANALWWGVNCEVYEGSLFTPIPAGKKFDLIFWNIPFISVDPGGVEAVEFRAGFDPGYQFQRQFLSEVRNYLSEYGELYLGADRQMCDLEALYQIFAEAGFEVELYRENAENWKGFEFTFIMLKLTSKV